MSRWMVRFWGFVTLAALIGLVVSSAWGQGVPRRFPPIKPNEQLAREALLGFTRRADEKDAERLLDQAHARLRLAVSGDPDAPRGADVILRRGYNAGEVEALLTRHSLGFASVEAKTPVSDGTVMTFWVSQYGPIRIPGTIAEQVERSLGHQRLFFLQRAQAEGDTEQGRWAREIATSHELGVYRVEVWGPQKELLALLNEPDVRGVIADADGARAASYEQARREMESQTIIRGPTVRIPIPDGPNSQLPPLPPEL